MIRILAVVAAAGLATLGATAAQADENYFGYTYSADTLAKGASEVELWATDRRGKGEGHYDAQDYRIELEHGFTNRLTTPMRIEAPLGSVRIVPAPSVAARAGLQR